MLGQIQVISIMLLLCGKAWAWSETPPPAPNPPVPNSTQLQITPPPNLMTNPAHVESLPSVKQYQAWILPLSAPITKAEADAMLAEVKQMGYPAYLEQSGQSAIVYIGPEVDQKRISDWKTNLQDKFSNIGNLQAFDPIQSQGVQS